MESGATLQCPDEETVLAFVEHRLPEEHQAAVDAHLDACSKCRALVAALARAPEHTAGSITESLEPNAVTPAGAPPAAAGTGIVLAEGDRVGRFLVLRHLGAGGMGMVYAAYDPKLDRKVALKLLHPRIGSHGQAHTRLMREAQAMARLSHPNVVAVYDVGTHRDQAFVAMELVEGTTLRAWLKARRHGWREVLSKFLQAGRGLSAVHEAGLVHRDFKPENVLLDDKGTPRVADFGLVRMAPEETPPMPANAPMAATVTKSGAVLGTPAYMSPEQLRGKSAGPESDQFSFCVALYEGLYGERPFGGTTLGELRDTLAAGAPRTPVPKSRVPNWLHRAVQKGLAVVPGERYPSMDALLDALARDPARPRRYAILGGALLAAIGFVAFVAWKDARVCSGGRDKVSAFWNPAAKEAIRSAFAASRLPYAESTWHSVEATLDSFARTWIDGHTEACEATHARREQSEEMLDLRMMCLQTRLEEMHSLVRVFQKGQSDVVTHAVEAAYKLSSVNDCADLASLSSPVKPPPAIRERVQALRAALADAKAHHDAGRYRRALEIAEPASAEARALGYRPLQAEALYVQAITQDELGDYRAAEGTLWEAVRVAEAGQHDKEKVKLWTLLVRVVGFRLNRLDEALEHGKMASAILERLQDDASQAILMNGIGMVLGGKGDHAAALISHEKAAQVLTRTHGEHPFTASAINHVGNQLSALGRSAEAIASYKRALEIREKTLGREHPDVAASLMNIGLEYGVLDDVQKALDHTRRALDLYLATLGPEHPVTASARDNLAVVYQRMGRWDEALVEQEEALRIRRSALPPDHPDVAQSLLNIGNVFLSRGDYANAESRYRAALAVREKRQGPEHEFVASVLNNLAIVLTETARLHEAQSLQERSLAIYEKAFGPDHPQVGTSLSNLGDIVRQQRRWRDALALYTRALAIREKALTPGHFDLSYTLSGIGLSHLGLGQLEEALPFFERALSVRARAEGDPSEIGEMRFGLARALVESKRDRNRAIELARRARADLGQNPERNRARLVEVERFLERYGKPHPLMIAR